MVLCAVGNNRHLYLWPRYDLNYRITLFNACFCIALSTAWSAAADAQCYSSSFRCQGATTSGSSFEDCCRPVVASNSLERSFSSSGGCYSCIGKHIMLNLYICTWYIIIFTVLGLNQSQYTLAERSAFYSLRLRLLSPANTLFLGRPRLRLLGVPGTASGKTFTSCIMT